MTPAEAARLAAVALEVASSAGQIAAQGFRKPKSIVHKGDIDLVTDFDTRTEEHIRERIASLTPGLSIVAEEQGGEPRGDLVWYADPIDGTTNYAHGHPFWCVSIGLLLQGRPVAGAVIAPSLGLSWSASEAGPALRNGEPCRVSAAPTLNDALLATGFPYDRRTTLQNNFDAFVAVKLVAQGIRRCGSAALDLCLVADGTYDGYWERKLKPWDLAAGATAVLCAGGTLSGFDGGPADVRTGNVVATNGAIHAEQLEVLHRVEQARSG